tara:strand:+ start:359 stop:544 length:186 start_codon:yes stop_codon:yes gene_type:complete
MLKANIGRAPIDRLVSLMYQKNYVLYDIVDLRYRAYDSALTGGDYFFVHKISSLLTYMGYE